MGLRVLVLFVEDFLIPLLDSFEKVLGLEGLHCGDVTRLVALVIGLVSELFHLVVGRGARASFEIRVHVGITNYKMDIFYKSKKSYNRVQFSYHSKKIEINMMICY